MNPVLDGVNLQVLTVSVVNLNFAGAAPQIARRQLLKKVRDAMPQHGYKLDGCIVGPLG